MRCFYYFKSFDIEHKRPEPRIFYYYYYLFIIRTINCSLNVKTCKTPGNTVYESDCLKIIIIIEKPKFFNFTKHKRKKK